jgi:hypothetical protein
MCPRETLTRKRGFMEFGLFEKIIKEVSGARAENPSCICTDLESRCWMSHCRRRIRLAKTCGIKHTYLVTNASLLFPETARKIIQRRTGQNEDQFLRHRRRIVSRHHEAAGFQDGA